MQRVGILTSGGDAPGMNAAVRAAVRMTAHVGAEPFAIYRGYQGILDRDGAALSPRDVSNIVHQGGTVLHAARCDAFFRREALEKAAEVLRSWAIDGLVVVGGDGTFRGAMDLARVWEGAIVGVPASIDNDLFGTDATIGFDTATHIAIESLDRIRDTAQSHDRSFVIEVMGRDAGFIAMHSGVGGGAEIVLTPEEPTDLDQVCRTILGNRAKGKRSSLTVVAEGDDAGDAASIAERIRERTGLDLHVTVLGHVQRGGRPTAADRVLATKLGGYAVETLREGRSGVMVGVHGDAVERVAIEEAITKKKRVDPYLQRLAAIVSE